VLTAIITQTLSGMVYLYYYKLYDELFLL